MGDLLVQLTPAQAELDYVKPKIKAGEHYVATMKLDSPINVQSTKSFLKYWHQVEATEPEAILLEINSPGGMVSAGFLVSQAIEQSDAPVICIVDGLAASMALFIFQSCDVRVMTKRGLLMAHAPLIPNIQMSGDQSQFKQMYDRLHALTEMIIYQYTNKSKVSMEEMRKRCADGGEWWIGWEEAIKYGFANSISPGIRQTTRELRKNGIRLQKD